MWPTTLPISLTNPNIKERHNIQGNQSENSLGGYPESCGVDASFLCGLLKRQNVSLSLSVPTMIALEKEAFGERSREKDGVCVPTESCPILCDLMGCSLPDSSVHGIF